MAGVSALGLVLSTASVAAQDAPAAVPEAPQADGEEIVVSGIRRSLESAQAVKQDSDQIVDSIVAEDIGKLPDISAAESLARVTGVTVERNNGVAQAVRVRGLSDLSTTYNGREMFTAEGRFVQLQDFPSNSIARIDVYKAASAELLEPGLAGLIDVRSRRPFDFKDGRIAGAITGVHWYQSQRVGVEANLLLSKRWDTGIGEMGFLIEGSYADTRHQDSGRNAATDIRNRTGVPGTTGAIRYPQFVNIDYVSGTRWRPNADAAFQWRPSNKLEIYLDGLYQGYRGNNDNHNLMFLTSDTATLSNVMLYPGTNLVKSMDATGGAASTGAQVNNTQWTDTFQGGGGFIYKDGPLKLTGDVALTDSTFTDLNYAFNFNLVTQPSRHYEFDTDVGAGGATVTLTNYDLTNPANYRWTTLGQNGSRVHGRSVQGRLDLNYRIEKAGISDLQAGVRYSTRDADRLQYTAPNGTANILFTALPQLAFQTVPASFRSDEAASVRTFLAPTRESLIASADILRTLSGRPTGQPAFDPPVFDSNEKIYSGYVQARYDLESLGLPIDGLIGVRATMAEVSLSGLRRSTTGTVTTVTPINSQSSYTDYLPNISARIRLMPDLQMRLAFTKTRTRPGFGQLNPTVTIGALPAICTTDPSSTDCIRSASSGNVDLAPIESTNFDASLEYYFSKSGSATVGFFRKDLNGFINNSTVDLADAEFTRIRLTRPENGGKGRINGVEASFRTFFRAPWLPNWLADFGGLVNYTYLDAKTELAGTLATTLPGLQPITGMSKHAVNLSGFYENRFFSARVSYNYRSDFVVSYERLTDLGLGTVAPANLGPTLPRIEDSRGTLDFAATLSPIENITLTFNATNLLGEAVRNDRQFNAAGASYVNQLRFLESVYRLGIRFRF
ncbi:MAG: TonB-dependent receptor [Sphingomonadales bacterium]|nr:MAG: TonB-dependent receptor [Sphingomonadales bacterium]